MKHPICLLLLLLLTACASVSSRTGSTDATREFHALLDENWEWAMREFPEWSTSLGERRYNDRWTDSTLAGIAARHAHNRNTLARLDKINRAALGADDQLNYDLFRYDIQHYVNSQQFPGDYLALDQMGGVHTQAAEIMDTHPRQTKKDYDDLLARLRATPQQVDNTIILLREGIRADVTQPRAVMQQALAAIERQIVESPEESPIYARGFAEMPDTISNDERERIRDEARAIIANQIMPAYKRLHVFVRDEYIPAAREEVAFSTLPNGRAWYDFRTQRSTTTQLTADEIHEIGIQEVARIRAEMERVKSDAQFDGTLNEFFDYLRTDPRFFHTEREVLLNEYRALGKRVDAKLPSLFITLPRLPYGIEAAPEYSEKFAPTAYYNQGSIEGARPGIFYANLSNLSARPTWEMQALLMHEAVPGHHLQIALAQELDGLPKFRRHSFQTAYVEGWGLYAESLGYEMGFYDDPYSQMGQLTLEIWRAIRLVVDTGIHAKGWTREQAIDYFYENSGRSREEIEREIDRYIVWPGQALAYKIGQMKIRELRDRASAELGEEFDVREFHDVVLRSGALPLDVLEHRVNQWIAKESE